LEWLHCFSRNERWKEEVLIVADEIRRVGAWHKNRVMRSSANVQAALQEANPFTNDWIYRGYRALLNLRKMEAEKAYDALPQMMREEARVTGKIQK
jgi:hypothetical protein